jgi:outer membrane protein TolC
LHDILFTFTVHISIMVKKIALCVFYSLCVLKASPQTTLDYYLQQGLLNSPLLKDYQNQISSAAVDSLLITAAQKPRLDANAQAMYAPSLNGFGYDEVITNGGSFAGGVGASQPLFNRKDLRNKYESIRIQRRSLVNTARISTNDLKRTITSQYITTYSDFTDLTFNRSFLKLMVDECNLMRQLVENAVYKQSDYLSLLIERQTQEILVGQMNSQYNKDLGALKQLCGVEDTVHHELAEPVMDAAKPTEPLQSPLFVQYKIDSMKIENDRLAVDLRYVARVNWVADAGINTSPVDFMKHFGVSAGINFTMPIYDGRQRQMEYQKLSLLQSTRANYEYFFKSQYRQQIRQLREELATNNELVVQLKKQLLTANELMSLAKSQLNAGNMPITEFVSAMKNYLSINNDIRQTEIKSFEICNQMNYWLQQ